MRESGKPKKGVRGGGNRKSVMRLRMGDERRDSRYWEEEKRSCRLCVGKEDREW